MGENGKKKERREKRKEWRRGKKKKTWKYRAEEMISGECENDGKKKNRGNNCKERKGKKMNE